MEATKTDMTAAKPLKTPIIQKLLKLNLNKKLISTTFKKETGIILKTISQLSDADKKSYSEALEEHKSVLL
jgi:hypothetical protein